MQRNIDPSRIVLGMMPRSCGECLSVQHVWFRTQDEYDKWECPECHDKKVDSDGSDEP